MSPCRGCPGPSPRSSRPPLHATGVTQHKNDNTAFHQSSEVSGGLALLRACCQWKISIAIYNGERKLACFVCLFCHSRSHFTKLLTRPLFLGPCHCSYIFVLCLAFHVHVASDLNKTISFVVGVLTTSFARALLGLIH